MFTKVFKTVAVVNVVSGMVLAVVNGVTQLKQI